MRPIAILVVGFLVIGSLWRARFGRRKGLPPLLVGTILAVVCLQMYVEGWPLQMFPAYLAVLVLLFCRRVALPGAGLTLMLAAVSVALLSVLPLFSLPAPTGPFPVGTRTLYLVDQGRSNAPAPGADGRDVAVQLWYPAGPTKNLFAPYRRPRDTTWRTSYMRFVPTNARFEAPVLAPVLQSTGQDAAPWHVLLFNPAWDSRRGQSTALVEELASQGYVVAAIDHPGRTGPIVLPDGRIVPIIGDPEVEDLAHSTANQVEAAIGRETDKEAADDSFVLDQLAKLNQQVDSPFYQRLDTDHAGALGHSLGGAVAADACSLDPRLHAAMSMSAPFFGKVRETGLTKPYLYISEELTLPSQAQMAKMDTASRVDAETDWMDAAALARMLPAYGGYQVIVRGINHTSFTDQAYYSPLRWISGVGPLPRDRALFILRRYAVQFFDKTLKGKPAPLLDSATEAESSPLPDVKERYFHPQVP